MKKYIIISLALLICGVVQAQEKGNYFYLNAGGGKHNIAYKPSNGTVKTNLGATANLGWNYFFNSHFGFGTGIGFQTFKSVATLNYMTANPAVDTDNDDYVYRIYYADWQETQNLFSLDIPIGFSYQTKFNEKSGMMFSVGAKISVPLSSKFKSSGGEINTKGFYSQYNVELYDMPQHDFYTLTSIPATKFAANTSYSVYADLGYLHNLSENLDLYLGIYGNYGLNNLINPSDNLVYQQGGTYNGVLSSNLIEKANLLSVGIKIGINLHIPTKEKTKADNKKVVSTPETIEVIPAEIVEDVKIEEVVPVEIVETVIIEEVIPVEEKVIVVAPKKQSLDIAKEIASELKINFKKNSEIPIIFTDVRMKEIAQLLIDNTELNVHIVGHTSSEGSEEVNIKLGTKRAESVKNVLMNYGVSEKQIRTETRYYLDPIAPNTTEENREKNRRAELFVK